jgi:hypothetical protein
MSAHVSQALATDIEFVVGHEGVLHDVDAISFTRKLYGGLADGFSLKESFETAQGVSRLGNYALSARSNPGKMVFLPRNTRQGNVNGGNGSSDHAKRLSFGPITQPEETLKRHGLLQKLNQWPKTTTGTVMRKAYKTTARFWCMEWGVRGRAHWWRDAHSSQLVDKVLYA